MKPRKRPVLLVSSAVYGFEELLDRLYAILDGLGYEVWMSHKGTVPVDPAVTALESCRKAVAACDLFLGIILPRYGSGKEKPGDESITHEELRHAIHLKKPRWILAHDHVVFARGLLNNLEFDTPAKRAALPLKKSALLEDLRVIDMYELATRHDIELLKDRDGNWVQTFTSDEDALLFATSQFRRYQEAEAFVSEALGNAADLEKALKRQGGKS